MPIRLGLPSPRISTKLYGIVALFLAMVYALVTAATQFAGHTEDVVSRLRQEALAGMAMNAHLRVLLEQHRRMVATAPFGASETNARDEGIYRDLNAAIIQLLDGLGIERAELTKRFALLASQGGSVFTLARDQQRDQAVAAAERHASAADGFALDILAEGKRRLAGAEERLDGLTERARTLTTWNAVAAALAGLAIGPLCLLLLHRMLARMQDIGFALVRLARNDTSVEIPGVEDSDEFGHLARSVAVFKAKSIELLNKKVDFERLNLQLDAAINNMPLGLSMFDAQERLLMCNRRYTDMYDVPAELAHAGTAHCVLWDHRTRRGARHSETRELEPAGATLSPSMLVEFSDGRIIEVTRQPIKGGGWVSLHEDVTERRRQEEKITYLARHDALTGLANRMLFRERLEQSMLGLAQKQGFAVLCLDLDRFKPVNDTLGHPVGDLLLKQVSRRLLGCVRHGDLVARLGGDEFAILQARIRDPKQTEALAARLVEAVSAPYEIDGNRVDIGTSIGVTLAPRDGSDANKLMKNADLALYRAKAAGRRAFRFFEAAMEEEAQVRRRLEMDLRTALGEDALELTYQPIVCLMSEKITGFDARVRWVHPRRGPITHDEFFTIAEESGLMPEVGRWTLQQACTQAVSWPASTSISVCVSSLQFLKRNLTESVLQALARSGLPPQRLELEIIESVLQQDADTLAILRQLRQLGIHVSVGDFGGGRSSLASLRAFPFDKIRIGRSFIADIGQSEQSRAIVKSVIGLAAGLRMTTVASGVEDFDQLEKLRGWGCSEGQGFLLGPPIAATRVEHFLAQRSAPGQGGNRLLTASPLNPESGGSAAPPGSWQAA